MLNNEVSESVAPKPEILKDWKVKLFVLLLCSLSFYAGWQSKQAYSNKQCRQIGGQLTLVRDKPICNLP